MAETIDYFFTSISPFVYLGHRKLMEIAARHGAPLRFRPFILGGVWENSGSVPLPQRSATRQRYRLVELQRIAEYRGETLNLHPAHFPVNPERADLCVAAITLAGGNPTDFVYETCKAVWARNLNISDEAVLAEILEATGHDAARMLDASRSEAAIAARQENTNAAIAADAIGAPAYVYKGEVFWGQDRLEMLEAMIASDRPAFSPS
ncbi:MAG: 2-hydroxychromene-2-carboxylate isomerase [Nitratireductor sp.]|nr:2-hydroxychromene-2-carboxylate isomerase [Nitratireductor sp.]